MIEPGMSSLSDHDQGGFTRVVSVSYSEKLIDSTTGAEISENEGDVAGESTMPLPPSPQRMDNGKETRGAMAHQTARLQQEILGELLTMSEEDREARLEQARHLEADVLRQVAQLDDPADRVTYLRDLDDKTHRLLLMGKIWASMLQKHGGMPPKLR
jgi:hypothetical protein